AAEFLVLRAIEECAVQDPALRVQSMPSVNTQTCA
ncbi:unnamed protein product, partial [marine sediment metagenome]